MRLIHEIREKRPALAKKADNGTPSAAIRLFCLECVGGSALDVRNCTAPECPLLNFRMGRGFRHIKNGSPIGETDITDDVE
jgi:hypothetical protein